MQHYVNHEYDDTVFYSKIQYKIFSNFTNCCCYFKITVIQYIVDSNKYQLQMEG